MIRQIARLFPSGSVLGGLAAALFCGPLCGLTLRAADEPEKNNEQEAQREQQLKNM